jgi:hypothetical protein
MLRKKLLLLDDHRIEIYAQMYLLYLTPVVILSALTGSNRRKIGLLEEDQS